MIYERLYDAVLFCTGALSVLIGAFTGYWFARNAMDRPFRSPHNPVKPASTDHDQPPDDDVYVRALMPPE